MYIFTNSHLHKSSFHNLSFRVSLFPPVDKFLDINVAFICPSVIFSGLGEGSLSSSIS